MALTQTEQYITDMVKDPVKRQKISDFMKTATPDQKTKAQELFKGISDKIKQEKSQPQVKPTEIPEQKPTTTPQKVFKKKSFDQINPVVDEWNGFKVRKNTKWQTYYFDKKWNAQLVGPKDIKDWEPILPKPIVTGSVILSKPTWVSNRLFSSNKVSKYTPPQKELTVPEKNDFVMYEFKQKYWRLPDLFNSPQDKKIAEEMYKNVYNNNLYKQKYVPKPAWVSNKR